MATIQKPTLSEIQTWLYWVFAHPEGVKSALEEKGSKEPNPRCLDYISDTPDFSKLERLQIYSNAYILRLREVLTKDFPITFKLVGESRFPIIVEQYLNEYPSLSFNISEVGRWFPLFLSRHSLSTSLPYLSDLASFEWLIGTTYFSVCLPPLNSESLSELSAEAWEKARLTINPTIRFFETKWPLNVIWESHHKNPNDPLPDLGKAPSILLVHRFEESGVGVKPLNTTQLEILKRLQEGKTLGEACDVFFSDGDDPNELMGWFRDWVETGLFRGEILL